MEDHEETPVLARCKRNTQDQISVFLSFGLIVTLLGIYGMVYLIDSDLPTPLNINDEPTHPDAFITERARADLKSLTKIGPRVAGGYQNENLTVEFLTQKIETIIQEAHMNHQIDFDIQVVSGSHYMNYQPYGKIEHYSNLQNVVVRLHGTSNSSQSLLVNAHFDSVPTSPGGSDDGINVAVMLEMLRKLTRNPERLLNHLIFLFNGAEETPLQASHGFITQHEWAKDCKVVLNLEAAGAGAKIILFQSGPNAPWLIKYYSQVPHPYGQAAGEEIFQTNLIPSDTDFRIFRDYGNLVGFDMAFFKNGYRYHTKYDDFEHIPPGSFQHVGDNALSLVRNLGDAPEVANPKENPGKIIYFDYLGWFLISYTETTALIINALVIVFSIVIFALNIHSFDLGFSKHTFKYLLLSFGAIIGGWIIAVLFVVLLALLIDQIGYSMSWYRNSWIIFGLYVAPIVGFSSILIPFGCYHNQFLLLNVKAQIQAHCVRMMWTVILFFGTILKIRAVYAVLIPVLFNTCGFMLIYIFKLQHSTKWTIIYVVSLIIPTMFLMYSTLTVLSLFIPITGRMGSDKNGDLLIGLLTFFLTIIITSPFVILATLVKNFKYILSALALVFVISFIMIFTPLGFPYSGNQNFPAPERYWIIHTQRVFYDTRNTEIKQDSGYFLLNMDRHSPSILRDKVSVLSNAESVESDCEKYLLCGLPLVHSKMIQIIKSSTWIPAQKPLLPEATKLEVISRNRIRPGVLQYNVSITGPDRLSVYLSPKSGIKILNISLIEEMSSEIITWNNRDLYFILHIYGKEAAPLDFTFDVEVSNDVPDVTTEIAVSGVFVHDDVNQEVPDYVQFLKEFPDWADVTAWLGSYESRWI